MPWNANMDRRPAPAFDMGPFKLVEHLGEGAYAETKLMEDPNTGSLVAVKFVPRGAELHVRIKREVLHHRNLQPHPNIVQFLGAFLTTTHLGIVMEYAEGGQLLMQVATAPERRMDETEARFYFQQLVEGVHHLHSQDLCHRDLKLENILVSRLSTNPDLKICDFGFVKCTDGRSVVDSLVGTHAYAPPEVLLALTDTEYDGKAADVWSCGVCLFVMVTGTFPFTDPTAPNSKRDTAANLRARPWRESVPPGVFLSPALLDLLDRTLQHLPAARPTSADIRLHPWMPLNWARRRPADVGVRAMPNQSEEELTEMIDAARAPVGPAMMVARGHFNEEAYFACGGDTDMHTIFKQELYLGPS